MYWYEIHDSFVYEHLTCGGRPTKHMILGHSIDVSYYVMSAITAIRLELHWFSIALCEK